MLNAVSSTSRADYAPPIHQGHALMLEGGEVGGRERMRGEREKGKEGGSHTNTPGHVKGPNKPCSLIINIFFLVFYVYNLDA